MTSDSSAIGALLTKVMTLGLGKRKQHQPGNAFCGLFKKIRKIMGCKVEQSDCNSNNFVIAVASGRRCTLTSA